MKSQTVARLAMLSLGLALGPLKSTWAQAPGPDGKEALYTKSLAATCANCHGTNGKATLGSTVPSLAGLDKNYIYGQMMAFKTGSRPATVMHQISKGYSDAQIESLSAYFAAQPK